MNRFYDERICKDFVNLHSRKTATEDVRMAAKSVKQLATNHRSITNSASRQNVIVRSAHHADERDT